MTQIIMNKTELVDIPDWVAKDKIWLYGDFLVYLRDELHFEHIADMKQAFALFVAGYDLGKELFY